MSVQTTTNLITTRDLGDSVDSNGAKPENEGNGKGGCPQNGTLTQKEDFVKKLLLLLATSAVVVLLFAPVASAQTYSMSASSSASSSAMMMSASSSAMMS